MVRNERRRRPVVRTAAGLGLVLIVWTLGSGRPRPAAEDPLRMGIEYLEAQRYGEAIGLFRSIAEKEKDNHEAHFYLGKAYFLEEHFPTSIEWLEKAVLLQPRNSQYHYWLARANEAQFQKAGLLSKMKYGKRFRDEIQRAVQLDGNNLDARFWLMVFYLTSPRSFGGDIARGLEQADAIKRTDLAYGYHAYITAYLKGKRFDLVENELLRRIESFPDRIDYKLDLSWFYLDQKDYPRAIQNSRLIAENHPDADMALFQIGRAAAESDTQRDLGKRCLSRYIGDKPPAERPHLEWAHFYLGRVLALEGDADGARGEYSSALRIVPGFQPAAQGLKKLPKRRS
jgi:tetratricopeptide (TPR) repeat protein